MLQKVVRSTVIDVPIERVWAVLRDFNSHDQWHDVVAASRIEHGEASSQVGCVRSFSLKDGNRTFAEWTAEFDCPPERETELVSNIGGGVFQGGFDALQRSFGG